MALDIGSFAALRHCILCLQDPLGSQAKENTEQVAEPQEQEPQAKEPQIEEPVEEAPASEEVVEYAQVEGGEYKIIGTRKTHVMKSGDYLTKIAIDEYGNKYMVQYIIVHNNFPLFWRCILILPAIPQRRTRYNTQTA